MSQAPQTLPIAVSDAALAPLEHLVIGDDLSGRCGANRSLTTRPQIAAETDRDAVLAWLARYADSPNTLANSRKEAERLMLWAIVELAKPLSSLTHEDLLVYQRFIADPQPVQRWVMVPGRKLGRGHPGWRPFAGPLSPASQRQAMVTLNAMFSWLVEAGYLAGNPLSLSRQRRRHAAPRVTRFLEDDLWNEVRHTIVAMPCQTAREQATSARTRWLMSLLYLCGLRISEVVVNTMGGFFWRADRAGTMRWWLQLTGKGNKERLVPATSELMDELARYRLSVGLSALPQPFEAAPLLFPVWWRAPGSRSTAIEWPQPLTRSALHGIVKAVFVATVSSRRNPATSESAYSGHVGRAAGTAESA